MTADIKPSSQEYAKDPVVTYLVIRSDTVTFVVIIESYYENMQ